jgi:hypothetical protein
VLVKSGHDVLEGDEFHDCETLKPANRIRWTAGVQEKESLWTIRAADFVKSGQEVVMIDELQKCSEAQQTKSVCTT